MTKALTAYLWVTIAVGAATLSIGVARAETPAERGAYLVGTIMTCNNCHTPMGPSGPQFDKALSGGLTFDVPPFNVTAPNITQDKETGIGNWTDAEIKQTLRSGIRPNGAKLAGVMPSGFYGAITEPDMDAIVAYLRTVKPISNKVPAPVYRVPVELEMFPGAEKPIANDGSKEQRGRYLATIGHCMECHTPMEKGMHAYSTSLGAGGQDFPGPWGTSVARNITSSKEKGLGEWTDAEIKRAITQGISRNGTKLFPPMGYPYYARMTAADLDALVAWLRTVPPQE
ncbi:MAG TPA: phosphomannomutase [Acetobacteraceae bacterium]|jgi:mono/diheme cytochrome c family protein|nr:phosphomannomutase [Acetobacteraceae bacterium]